MSVKIEILDYKYGSGINLVDVNQAPPVPGWTAVSTTNAAWDGSGSGITYLSNISSQFLVIGTTYNLSFKISGYTGVGDMGFSTASGVPLTARFSSNTSGIQYFTFVATATSFPDLFGQSVNSGTISSISITDASVIDWDNSIVGELDVTDHSDFPLAMTFQISDFKDLTSTTGDYSKTFKVPATKNNNNLLKHLYRPNISNENKVTEKKSCRILFNNIYSLVGLIQVDGVGGYGETPSHYSCVFFGSNLSWADKIQDTYMNAIEWGAEGENLTYNKDSIVATWQHEDCNNASNSPIVYPITSYGDYNELGTASTIQLLDTAYGAGASTSSQLGYSGFWNTGNASYGTPPPVSDWRPSVFVKTTLDKIFNAVGYTINSAFMNTDMFKKLVWLLPNFKYNNPEDRDVKYSYGNSFTGEGLISSTLIAPINSPSDPQDYSYIESAIDLNDAGADFVLNSNTDNTGWNATTGVFTAQEYGNYLIKLNNFGLYATRDVYNGGSLNVLYARIRLQVKTVGQTSWNTLASTQTNYFSDTGSNPLSNDPARSFNGGIDNTIYLNKGDQLRLNLIVKAQTLSYSGNQITIHLFGSSTPTSTTTSGNANGRYNIDINPLYVEYGQTYNLTDVMNTDYKQIDFVKGIAHAFNLQMTTDESTKTVNIEPFDSFYKPYSDAIDWTYKLDRSSETSDKWLESDLKRTLVFKYKSDNADAKVKARGIEYFREIEDEFPYREELPDTFKKGDSTFENPFFAGTYNGKDMDTTVITNVDTAYSACLWTENTYSYNVNRPTKGYDFLPRLLYWNKYSPATSLLGAKRAIVQTWTSTTKSITADASATLALSTIYPQATMINRDSTTSPILSYGNVNVRDYDDATGIYTYYRAGKGLFDTYYKNMIEGLKRRPRLRTVSVSLKITDIVSLDFTKLVYIDGVYWRINKVIDYKPNNNESTKVELIEWFQIGIFAATAPIFGGGSGWNPDGSQDDNNDIGL